MSSLRLNRAFRLFAVAALASSAIPLSLSSQAGLPFSGLPTGGMGGAPGISAPAASRTPVAITHTHRGVFPRHFPTSGATAVFFGADEAAGTSVVVNNIFPAEQARQVVIEERPAAPALVIEREGDQWVRRTLADVAPGEKKSQTVAEVQMLPARAPEPLRETELVFRDGHKLRVATYTIIGGALYHSTPAWSPQQKLSLSELDLAATEALNRRAGVSFRLPNSPNEVVTRP